MGVVYNSIYLIWFEIGRTEWLRDRGFPYRQVEKRGIALPVTEARLRLIQPARYDDLLSVETRLLSTRSRAVVFAYRILREGAGLAEGTTFHTPVDLASGRTTRIPGWLEEALGDPEAPAC